LSAESGWTVLFRLPDKAGAAAVKKDEFEPDAHPPPAQLVKCSHARIVRARGADRAGQRSSRFLSIDLRQSVRDSHFSRLMRSSAPVMSRYHLSAG